MHVISLVNRKGGVGKTSTALNVVYELTRKGYTTLAIDLDGQSDLTKTLGASSEDKGIKEVLEGKVKIEEAIKVNADNIKYISGSSDLNYYKKKKSNKLERILEHKDIKDIDYVVIDHPPAITDASLQGLLVSDSAIIVTDLERFSLDNLEEAIKDLLVVAKSSKKDFRVLGILANKVDARRSLARKNLEETKSALGDIVFNTSISYNTIVPLAQERKVKLRALNWNKVTRQYRDLTDEIIMRTGEDANEHGTDVKEQKHA